METFSRILDFSLPPISLTNLIFLSNLSRWTWKNFLRELKKALEQLAFGCIPNPGSCFSTFSGICWGDKYLCLVAVQGNSYLCLAAVQGDTYPFPAEGQVAYKGREIDFKVQVSPLMMQNLSKFKGSPLFPSVFAGSIPLSPYKNWTIHLPAFRTVLSYWVRQVL